MALFPFIDCSVDLSRGVEFDPRLGYRIDDPEDFQHNGTYLCEFTDTGKGKKFSTLVIDLLVTARKVTKTFVKVNIDYLVLEILRPYDDIIIGRTSTHVFMLEDERGGTFNYC